MTEESLIYLFDESGRAILSPTDPHVFLGASVLYEEIEEEYLFNTCDKIFRLSTDEPLKNYDISNDLIKDLEYKLVELNKPIVCIWIDLNNKEMITKIRGCVKLLQTLKDYHNVRGRRKTEDRYIRDRVLDKNIFDLLKFFLYGKSNICYRIKPFIDNISIPQSEITLSLEYRSISIEKTIKEISKYFSKNISINVESIKLLKNISNKRKRFIDVVTSILSRSINKHDNKYIFEMSPVIQTSKTINFVDYTQGIVDHSNKLTDDLIKNNPVI